MFQVEIRRLLPQKSRPEHQVYRQSPTGRPICSRANMQPRLHTSKQAGRCSCTRICCQGMIIRLGSLRSDVERTATGSACCVQYMKKSRLRKNHPIAKTCGHRKFSPSVIVGEHVRIDRDYIVLSEPPIMCQDGSWGAFHIRELRSQQLAVLLYRPLHCGGCRETRARSRDCLVSVSLRSRRSFKCWNIEKNTSLMRPLP